MVLKWLFYQEFDHCLRNVNKGHRNCRIFKWISFKGVFLKIKYLDLDGFKAIKKASSK